MTESTFAVVNRKGAANIAATIRSKRAVTCGGTWHMYLPTPTGRNSRIRGRSPRIARQNTPSISPDGAALRTMPPRRGSRSMSQRRFPRAYARGYGYIAAPRLTKEQIACAPQKVWSPRIGRRLVRRGRCTLHPGKCERTVQHPNYRARLALRRAIAPIQ